MQALFLFLGGLGALIVLTLEGSVGEDGYHDKSWNMTKEPNTVPIPLNEGIFLKSYQGSLSDLRYIP